MTDQTTTDDPATEGAPAVLSDADALARLREIRDHLAPVADLQKERLRLLVLLKDTHEVALETIAEADGATIGAVRVSLSKARRQPPPDTTT